MRIQPKNVLISFTQEYLTWEWKVEKFEVDDYDDEDVDSQICTER